MGIMSGTLALDEQQPAPEQAAAPVAPEQPAGQPAGRPPVAEMGDDDFENVVERVSTAAARVMGTPEMVQSLKTIVESPDPVAVADMAHSLLVGINEKSGGRIPEEAFVACGFEIIGMIAEVSGIPPRAVAEATQRLLLRMMVDRGSDPAEISQVMETMDFDAMSAQAVQAAGE